MSIAPLAPRDLFQTAILAPISSCCCCCGGWCQRNTKNRLEKKFKDHCDSSTLQLTLGINNVQVMLQISAFHPPKADCVGDQGCFGKSIPEIFLPTISRQKFLTKRSPPQLFHPNLHCLICLALILDYQLSV